MCFVFGARSAFLDFHRMILEQMAEGHRPPVSYLSVLQTNAFLAGMGVISLGFFAISVRDPTGWLGGVLKFGADNVYLRAVLIGLATNVLVRIKLIEVRGT